MNLNKLNKSTSKWKLPIKDKGFSFQFKDVPISFPNLKEPTHHPKFPDGPRRFSVQINMSREMATQLLETLESHISENDLPPINYERLKLIEYTDGDNLPDNSLKGWYRRLASAKELFPPIVKIYDYELQDAIIIDKNKMDEIQSGDICRIKVRIKHVPGISCQLGDYTFYLQEIIKIRNGDWRLINNSGEPIDLSDLSQLKENVVEDEIPSGVYVDDLK